MSDVSGPLPCNLPAVARVRYPGCCQPIAAAERWDDTRLWCSIPERQPFLWLLAASPVTCLAKEILKLARNTAILVAGTGHIPQRIRPPFTPLFSSTMSSGGDCSPHTHAKARSPSEPVPPTSDETPSPGRYVPGLDGSSYRLP